MKFLRFCFPLSFIFCFHFSVSAQILINEYSASNKSQYADSYNDYPDWIEIYNNTAGSVNLSGFFLSDSPGNLQKWAMPSQSIASGQTILFFASGRDVFAGGNYHTSFKLTQMKSEKIIISNTGGTIIDSLTLKPTQKNHSRGRVTDGAAGWGIFTTPTPGNTNANAKQEYATKPVFSLAPGFYTGTQSLAITSPDPGVQIRYTTNGDDPTVASTLYTAPISIATTRMIRAVAFSSSPAVPPSFTEENTYLINANHNGLAVISMASPDYPNLFNSSMDEIMTTIEYFDTTGQFQFEMEGDIRGHGNDSWAYAQKGMRFYTRDDYGYANNIDFPLFTASQRQEFDVILIKAAGSDNFPGNGLASCHLRDGFSQTLAQKHHLNVDVRSYEPCVVYLNGQYWGLYEIRERVDADYANYYFNQDVDSVDMLAYWGGLTIEEGSDTAWDNLYAFMLGNDLTIPANHDYVADRFEMISLIDYFILNTFVINTDWLNWNTAWWRGNSTPGVKWRYRLWDQDNIFNLGQNYTGVGTTTYDNDPCNPTTLFPGDPDVPHTDMLNALMADTVFHDLYINRYADLLNTAFDCDTMMAHLQAMIDVLAPEMPQHLTRWGGTLSDWNDNLDSVKVQIQGRCSVVDSLMVDCYNLSGPYDITVLVDPPLGGDVKVNTIVPTVYPYVGTYYGGVNLNLYALENASAFPFINWTLNNHTLNPGLNADSVSLTLTSGDTLIAHFDSAFVSRQELNPKGYSFSAYPTLVKNKILVDYEIPSDHSSAELFLYDLSGHTLADFSSAIQSSVSSSGHRRVEINLADSQLAQGIYMLHFRAGEWKKTVKIVWMGE